jgi:hypothetical protein
MLTNLDLLLNFTSKHCASTHFMSLAFEFRKDNSDTDQLQRNYHLNSLEPHGLNFAKFQPMTSFEIQTQKVALRDIRFLMSLASCLFPNV